MFLSRTALNPDQVIKIKDGLFDPIYLEYKSRPHSHQSTYKTLLLMRVDCTIPVDELWV